MYNSGGSGGPNNFGGNGGNGYVVVEW
jgi:hypothetical protein